MVLHLLALAVLSFIAFSTMIAQQVSCHGYAGDGDSPSDKMDYTLGPVDGRILSLGREGTGSGPHFFDAMTLGVTGRFPVNESRSDPGATPAASHHANSVSVTSALGIRCPGSLNPSRQVLLRSPR